MISASDIGKRISKFRKKAGITQTELAQQMNKSLRTIQKYENGDIDMPLSVLYTVAGVLGVTADELLGKPCNIQLTGIEAVYYSIEEINIALDAGLLLDAVQSDKRILSDATVLNMFSCLMVAIKTYLATFSGTLAGILKQAGAKEERLKQFEAEAFSEKNNDELSGFLGEMFAQCIGGSDGEEENT